MISYLTIENISKHIGDITLFENVSFGIGQGQKVAMIAKNGTGKTTMLRMIAGQDSPDTGEIIYRKGLTVGYLPQLPQLDEGNTILGQVRQAMGDIMEIIEAYERSISSGDQSEMQDAMQRMDEAKAWDVDVRSKQVLSKLKLEHFDQKIGELSGGQQKRVALACVLIKEPDFLILDEPTNHLDLDMIEWLEEYLKRSKCTLLMVTHDRYFLDRVCNDIIEMEDGRLYRYAGNYSYYLEKRGERVESTNAEIEKARNLLRKELEWMRRMPQARGTKAKYRVDNFYDLQEKASQNKVAGKMQINVQGTRLGSKIINIHNIYKSFGEVKILEDFSYLFKRNEKVGIVGQNGTGKSTFLNLITGRLQSDRGIVEIGETVKIGYYTQDGIRFKENEKVIDAVQEIAEVVSLGNGKDLSVSQFLNYFMFPPKTQHNYISKLSGGERRRLYLCTVLMQNPNFLILDEPTNDLDIMTLNVLEDYLQQFQGCVLLVSHDRYFMDKIVDHLFVFEGQGKVKDFPGDYTLYRSYVEAEDKERRGRNQGKAEKIKKEKPKTKVTNKLTYKERMELEQVEKEIAGLEQEKSELEEQLSSGTMAADEVVGISERHGKISELLEEKEFRWLELSEREQ